MGRRRTRGSQHVNRVRLTLFRSRLFAGYSSRRHYSRTSPTFVMIVDRVGRIDLFRHALCIFR